MVRELLLKRLANVTRCTKGYGGAFVGVPLKYFNLIRKTMKHVMKQFIRCKCDYSSTKDICNSFCGPYSGKWQTFLFFLRFCFLPWIQFVLLCCCFTSGVFKKNLFSIFVFASLFLNFNFAPIPLTPLQGEKGEPDFDGMCLFNIWRNTFLFFKAAP